MYDMNTKLFLDQHTKENCWQQDEPWDVNNT